MYISFRLMHMYMYAGIYFTLPYVMYMYIYVVM